MGNKVFVETSSVDCSRIGSRKPHIVMCMWPFRSWNSNLIEVRYGANLVFEVLALFNQL
jgi:hypothetical protein